MDPVEQGLMQQVSELQDRVSQLESRVQNLENRPQPGPDPHHHDHDPQIKVMDGPWNIGRKEGN